MRKILKLVFILTFLFAGFQGYAQSKMRVICIGNSITYGSGLKNRAQESYPARLQALAGTGYEVLNFGVSGATMLKKGNHPYWNTPEYQQALQSNPDLVFIKLGTNDSKDINREQMGDFEKDYVEMIHAFRALPKHPRIVLLLPVKAFSDTQFGISGTYIRESIIPTIQKIAYDENLEVIDLYSWLSDQEPHFPDKVHPDASGAAIIATRLYELLLFKTKPGSKPVPETDKSSGNFYGYKSLDFSFEGHKSKIVVPKRVAIGTPWIWRARFWGHEPQTDIALLERGFHVVYCDVAELFGNREAIHTWNNFYAYLRKIGFAKKAVMEGMSRGGVYVYNWAAANPDKVACVYADNPVLDLKSWPGGNGAGPGSKESYADFLKAYDLKTPEAVAAFHGSPLDKVKAIVKGRYPMLHVCGDKDEVVPMIENTLPFAEAVTKAGGSIRIIHKPEGKHHPHSLPNPQPIVDFILKSLSGK